MKFKPQRRRSKVASLSPPSLNERKKLRKCQIEAYARLATADKNEFLKLKAEIKRVGYTSMRAMEAMHTLADASSAGSDCLDTKRDDDAGSRRWQWWARRKGQNHEPRPVLPIEDSNRNLHQVRSGDGRAPISSGNKTSFREKLKPFSLRNIPSIAWTSQPFEDLSLSDSKEPAVRYTPTESALSGGKRTQEDVENRISSSCLANNALQENLHSNPSEKDERSDNSLSEGTDDATVEQYLQYLSSGRWDDKSKRSTSIISVDLSEDFSHIKGLEQIMEEKPRQNSRLGGGVLSAVLFFFASAALIIGIVTAQAGGNGQQENNLDHNGTLPGPITATVTAQVGGNGQQENNLDHNGTLPGLITATITAQVGGNGQGENNLAHNGLLPRPCRDMEIAYNTAVHGMLGFDTKTIKEYICNNLKRQEIVDFITNLDASTMDDCEAMIYGPIVAIKFKILERLTDEDTCRAELEEELSMFPQGFKLGEVLQSGQHEELLDPITISALIAATAAATTSVKSTYHDCEETWNNGVTCVLGNSCNCCKNEATYWYGKAATACGEESCWGRDIYCLAGTSCNNCCSSWKWSGSGAYCL